MTKRVSLVTLILFAVIVGGCSTSTLPLLGGGEQRVPYTVMDSTLKKSFPIAEKTPYGTVTILGASTLEDEGKLLVKVPFRLVSFEIPEGIDGVASYHASVRYDPGTKRLYLKDLQPLNVKFLNRTLVEYVSPRAFRGIPPLIAKRLERLPLTQAKEGPFTAAGVKLRAEKEGIVLTFR